MTLGAVNSCVKAIIKGTSQLCRLNSERHLSLSSRLRMAASSVNTITSHESTVNGTKLHWETAGSGPHSVLLLPGALGSTRTDFLPQLTKLDGKLFTLYAWDPPGYGRSRPPDRTWPDKFFNRDADCAAALIRHLGLDKVSLVGWSDGGITALVMAVFHPELLDKLVLFGCNAYITPRDVEYVEAIRDLDKWSERMRKPFEDVYGRDYFESHWNQWIDSYGSYLSKHKGDIVKERVREIKNPSLIIHGQKDALVRQEHPDFLHSQIADSQLINWPEAKHNLHLRYADEFNAEVTKFLVSG